MKISHLVLIIALICLFQATGFSQSGKETASDSTLLGLPGDNLDLVAVLDLFQKSKTIEDFEKSLNEEKTGINNLDLNLDGKDLVGQAFGMEKGKLATKRRPPGSAGEAVEV